jgi:hypothetical protein
MSCVSGDKNVANREKEREVGLAFPAHHVVILLIHAADSGRGTFDCQRADGWPMIPRMLTFVQRPVAPGSESRIPIRRDRPLAALRTESGASIVGSCPSMCPRQSEIEAAHA